ncbi:helix-turn-helix domain-containing protein [Methanosarcina siciliae]|uniref:helix-turn-helix domain-containing protein n=1 Tax=Methanosarcina siciliae TaxID=38027 RepID=UPI00064EA8A8|nr:helix-turn-helix domain-containing protein [Methanosarcina siciliae]
MKGYENKKIKAYADEMPAELRRVIDALNSDIGLATFFVLFKYGEMSFSQIMNELEIPPHHSSKLTYHIKKLQKSALVKNEYVKKENADGYSFYDITEFGEGIINNLMNAIRVPQSSNLSMHTLGEKITFSQIEITPLKSEGSDCNFAVKGVFVS